jgi:hypothetical protein
MLDAGFQMLDLKAVGAVLNPLSSLRPQRPLRFLKSLAMALMQQRMRDTL